MSPTGKVKPLGERLIEMGVITPTQLELALKLQKRTGEILGEVLVKLGFVSQEVLTSALAAQSNVSQVDLNKIYIEPEPLKLVPESFARKHRLIPIAIEENTLTVAMENIFDVETIEELEKTTGCLINVVAATENEILNALDVYYSGGITLDELIEESIAVASREEIRREALIEEAPIVKLVNQIIMKGIKEGATDIHIEPEEQILRVRYRIDGVMVLGPTLPKALQNAVIARLKIISEANIAETRLPQDGRIRFNLGKKQIDIRVSFFPVIYGENVVLRILDKSRIVIGLELLGMSPEQLQQFKDVIERTYGLILVTGPTGSGKTTTLYSALAYLNSLEKNIVTLEDPVEYEFPIIRQSQVNYRINYTFADGLRTILRQDPDIILVGEMRDQETIDMAIRSALTGHLVMSTLHTNNSVATISRLTDMGAEPFLIASTLLMIISQRLVRKICENCRIPQTPDRIPPHIRRHLPSNFQFFTGQGCERCNQIGFKGRIAVFEILTVSDALRELIENKAPGQELWKQARADGLKTLFDDALDKARKGIISAEEAVKIAIGM